MGRGLIFSLFVLIISVYLSLELTCFPENVTQTNEKSLGLEDIFRTSYALSGDTAGIKQTEESVYLSKGNIQKALSTLKGIIIEKKRPDWIFSKRDSINIIVFRGILSTQGKIEITKMVSKGNSFEIYAKYIDFPELDIPSEPVVIIPLGKLPSGKYTVALYINDQVRKKVEFKVRGYIHI